MFSKANSITDCGKRITSIVILSDSYAPAAQDAMVKQGLMSFANTLLKAK
jgi:hypothetical protein